MNNKINIINDAPFIDAFSKIECGAIRFAQIDAENFEIPFSEVKPIKGFEIPENESTKEKLPNCCDYHLNMFQRATSMFEAFPNCCEPHKKLLGTNWFNKNNYKDVATKIVSQVAYTEFHILKQIDIPEWYKDITDYIDANVEGFGQLPAGFGSPVGLHLYLLNVKNILLSKKEVKLPAGKKQKLIEYVNNYYGDVQAPKTDLNLLYSTYQKWLKVFPFEISYLKELKKHYAKQLPFISGKLEYNQYTGTSRAKMQTQSGLVEALIKTTEKVLTEINGLVLQEKGLITDGNELQIEIINENRRIELEELREKPCNDKAKFIKIIKEWLKGEKEYFKDITPLLKERTVQNTQKEQQLSSDEIFRQEIDRMYEIPLSELDIDNYVNWVLTHKSFTREKKKEMVLSLIGLREKTIKNYKSAINEVFYKTKYWKEPTPQELENFPLWREHAYKRELDFLNFKTTGSALPLKEIKRQELVRVEEKLNQLFPELLRDLYNKWLPKDFYSLADMVGIIDYLKYLSNTNESGENVSPEESIKAPSILGISDPKGGEVHSFSYGNIEAYFFDDKITAFKQIENELLLKKCINDKGEWIANKAKLVALIHILKQLKYLRNKLQGKTEKTSLVAYRRFFENRYHTKLTEQMKPSNFKIGRLKVYKPDFSFIPEIDNI